MWKESKMRTANKEATVSCRLANPAILEIVTGCEKGYAEQFPENEKEHYENGMAGKGE